ncbi:50S ribosomal protein L30 [bacterium]|nr:50S ribosomal protein L30 [bacterium]
MAKLKITQVRSTIKRQENQKRTMTALGLRKLHQTVIHNDTPQIRGMVRKVSHLLKVEEVK